MSGALGTFKPDTKTLKDVFGGPSSHYQIPLYQRPYNWEDEHIEQLWEDLHSAFQANDDYYFLGPVVLANTNEGHLEVIDGQQRLTTLTILFCVLRDFYFARLRKRDDVLKNQILDAIQSMVDKRYRLRLITQVQYHSIFQHEILDRVTLPKVPLTNAQKQQWRHKFTNAAALLKRYLDTMYHDRGVDAISDFVRYILDHVIFVTITCSNRVSAIKVFQIINTRGLELDLADLVKSSLLSRLESDRESREFMSSWSIIESIAERHGESVTDILTYYAYYLLGARPRRSLYEALEKPLRDRSAKDITFDLRTFAEHYDDLQKRYSAQIDLFTYLRDKVYWKTILVTARMVRFQDVEALCRGLVKVYYSYWIAGYTIAKIRDFAFTLIRTLKANRSLARITKAINLKMKKDSVIDYLEESLESDVDNRPWIKPLLICVERAQTDQSLTIAYGQNVQIDHILPIKWRNHEGWKKKWTDEMAEKWIGKLGNLTLLSGPKNIAASDDEFKRKKTIYEGKGKDGLTSFEISKRIVKVSDWTEKEVEARQKWLVGQVSEALRLRR